MIKTLALVSKSDDALALRACKALSEASSKFPFKITQGLPSKATSSDLVICIGGDGTLLSTIRKLGASRFEAQILGVHGSKGLGFLHTLRRPEEHEDPSSWATVVLEMLVQQKYISDTRWGLETEVSGQKMWALNDIVINKGSLSRMIELELRVGNEVAVPCLRGDGLIISSPTGSTAYALSAGGPILDPAMRAVLLTPVCSHTFGLRPIVVTPEKTIYVRRLDDNTTAQVTADGQEGAELAKGNEICVRAASQPVRLLVPMSEECRAPQYFDVLKKKLGFGRDRDAT